MTDFDWMEMSSLPEAESGPVVVVGAGLSGLVAARLLARSGLEVIVLEAAERVGGRVRSETSALGSRLDLGGQWIGVDHHRVAALARESGEVLFERSVPSVPTAVDGTRRVRWLSASGIGAAGAALALCAIAAMAPSWWSNQRSVGSLLNRLARGRARRLLRVGAELSWTADLDRLSLYGLRRIVRAQHGLSSILSASGGAQQSLVIGGVGSVVDHLAEELGDRVRVGERVVSLTTNASGVAVRTAGSTYQAAKVIVTVPAPIAAGIDCDPPLPQWIREYQQSTEMGSVYKAIAVYERPFWRGGAASDLLLLFGGGGGGGGAVFDTSPPGGPGHLCVLVGGKSAKGLDALSREQRMSHLLGPLAAHYGSGVLQPSSWHEKAWHLDPDVRGGYVALPTVGTLGGFWPHGGAPEGHIHWAGSETATQHPGYLDGAVESGQRAAAEVLAALS